MNENSLPVIVTLVACLCLAAGTCVADEEGKTILEPGVHKMTLEMDDGSTVRYAVHFPEKIDEDAKVPLIVALHYGGRPTPYFGLTFSNMFAIPAFKDLGGIIVAPDCPARGWANNKSAAVVLKIMDHAIASWPVDEHKVVLTGYSTGGLGVYYIALRHAERISAIVPVASKPHGFKTIGVPLYAVNSVIDERVDYQSSAEMVTKLEANGVPAELVLVEDLSHFQTSRFAEPASGAVEWLRRLWKPAAE